MSQVIVTYDSNNSGGFWWLSDSDWDALAEAGWNVHWGGRQHVKDALAPVEDTGQRYLGARAVSAAKKFERPEDAIEEFERVTGQDASDEGCNCCGNPHSFDYEDAEGNRHFTSVERVETRITFD